MNRTDEPRAGVPATEAVYDLGEGVLWDDRAQLVRWVDIRRGRVLAGRLHHDGIEVVDDVHIGQTAGAVALAEDGGLLVAAARALAVISPDGVVAVGPPLLDDRAGVRFNDGAVDPHGSFVVGSLTIGGDTGEEVLLRVHPDGRVETLRDGIRLSNGIAFSPDGATIYHVDTLARTVASHSYRAGAFDRDEPWVTVLDRRHLPAHPDGLTVDREGALWVAQHGGGSVRRHAPTGELLDVVVVDAGPVTCAGFVGPHLDRLAITTGPEGGESDDRSGALFLADTDVPGLPEHRWAGSTIAPWWIRP